MPCKGCSVIKEFGELYECGVCSKIICVDCLPNKEYRVCPGCYEELLADAKARKEADGTAGD
jgi:hypothetical protein